MFPEESVNCLVNSNAGVHRRDLMVEIVMLRVGECGRHCDWLSFGLGRRNCIPSNSKDYSREILDRN